MTSYAVKSSGIKGLAANTFIGNVTGSAASAGEHTYATVKTELGLGSADSPSFTDLTLTGTLLTIPSAVTITSDATAFSWDLATTNGWGRIRFVNTLGVINNASNYFGWTDDANRADTGTVDAKFYRFATGATVQKDSTTAQYFAVSLSDDGAGNYTHGVMDWQTTAGVLRIGTDKAGTGASADVDFVHSGTRIAKIMSNHLKIYGHLRFNSTIYDIGESTVLSAPRNIYSQNDVEVGNDLTVTGTAHFPRVVQMLISDPNGDAITTGDGKAYFKITSNLAGYNLTAVSAHVSTASTSGVVTVQIRNETQTADMLTTEITIDANETDSDTALTAAVIDAANDDVADGDIIQLDIDTAGTGAKGLLVEMKFTKP